MDPYGSVDSLSRGKSEEGEQGCGTGGLIEFEETSGFDLCESQSSSIDAGDSSRGLR
jgi:hypothetical protein